MNDLKDVKTCELVEELKKREGIDFTYVDPYEYFSIFVGDEEFINMDTGPALIMVIID